MKLYHLALIGLLMLTGLTANAQKFAYLNSSQIIMMHPDVKAADQKLVNYQNQLVKKGEDMAKKLEANYNAYVAQVNEGLLSKVQMQEKEAALGAEQDAIRQYEMEMQQLILQKREELYQPILDKIQVAVDEVGREKAYTMIFDSSTGGILHAQEADNIFELVKAKLGL